MKATRETIEAILDLEWEFFQATQNIGGRARCQDDEETFRIMWTAELRCWSEEMARSWLQDLKRAAQEGRNPVSEKYARMMESTAPEEYAALAHRLPPVGAEAFSLAAELTAQTVRWAEEAAEKYPRCCARARPIHATSDGNGVTSVETYTMGELLTYSVETLRLFKAYYAKKAAAGENLYIETQDQTARLQGFASLAEAEEKISNRQGGSCCLPS